MPDSVHAQIYRDIAAKTWAEVQAAAGKRIKPPAMIISPAGDSLNVAFEGSKPFDLTAEMLRVMSPSAEVQGHSEAERVTVAKKQNVKIRELSPVGNYAVRIAFDDGHDTGLFTWDYLQLLDRERDSRWKKYLGELKAKGLGRT
jgi:ATP-binding protein involved in chromosome partitioning